MIGNKELAGSIVFLLWTTNSIQRITASKTEKRAIKDGSLNLYVWVNIYIPSRETYSCCGLEIKGLWGVVNSW